MDPGTQTYKFKITYYHHYSGVCTNACMLSDHCVCVCIIMNHIRCSSLIYDDDDWKKKYFTRSCRWTRHTHTHVHTRYLMLIKFDYFHIQQFFFCNILNSGLKVSRSVTLNKKIDRSIYFIDPYYPYLCFIITNHHHRYHHYDWWSLYLFTTTLIYCWITKKNVNTVCIRTSSFN